MSIQFKAYQKLKKLVAECPDGDLKWAMSNAFGEWTADVIAALKRLSDDPSSLQAFNSVDYTPGIIMGSTPRDVFEGAVLSGLGQAKAILRSAIREYEDFHLVDDQVPQQPQKSSPLQSRRVFVVHGRDAEMKLSVMDVLRKLELPPIVLHEQANGSRTLIEKFEHYADVGFAVILLSPDDVGALAENPKPLEKRARQNVIFEMGFFIGKLGRNRVCVLLKEELGKPSDIDGVAYVPYPRDWKTELIRELKESGLDVDANKII